MPVRRPSAAAHSRSAVASGRTSRSRPGVLVAVTARVVRPSWVDRAEASRMRGSPGRSPDRAHRWTWGASSPPYQSSEAVRRRVRSPGPSQMRAADLPRLGPRIRAVGSSVRRSVDSIHL